MDKTTEEKCKEYIGKYYRYKQKEKKIKVRNDLYVLMSKDMDTWIKSILRRWGRNLEQTEIISLSWDAFLFCLKRYDRSKEGGLSKFFFEAIRYFLLMEFAKKDIVKIEAIELKEILKLDHSPEAYLFERLLTLQQFRGVIPEEQLVIWDEATMSLSDSFRGHLPQKARGMSTESYARLKKVFINIIRLILK